MKLTLKYCATKDGFNLSRFHELCDQIGKTLIVIKSEHNQIFGAYCDKPWNTNGKYIEGDGKSFLFSFTKNRILKCVDKNYEMYGSSSYFQLGPDLCIFNDSNMN